MKRRIAIWAAVGFVVASCWVLFSFFVPPERLITIMREPFVVALAYATCPIAFALRRFALHFWWVPLINAATYACIGLVAELFIMMRRMHHKTVSPAI